MEDNFYQDDFERFLKEQADSHRMFPSDQIWRNIHKQIHGDKRWPALTVAAFILMISTVAICIYLSPKPNLFTLQPLASGKTIHVDPATTSKLSGNTFVAINNGKVSPGINSFKPAESFSSLELVAKASNNDPSSSEDLAIGNSNLPAQVSNVITHLQNESELVGPKKDLLDKSTIINLQPLEAATTQPLLVATVIENKAAASTLQAQRPAKKSTSKEEDEKSAVDKFLKENQSDVALYTSTPKIKSTKNTFNFGFYITPSISYRKLKEDRSYLKQNVGGPVALNYVADVHQIVRHKPGKGLEAGAAVYYSISPKLKLSGGLQVNFRQYAIEAFRAGTELAAIALVTSQGVDTINRLAFYRTTSGNYAAEIRNQYYQVSVPIGIEWQIIGNKNMQLNVAASTQPTYSLNQNAYVLSSNLKNYTESPELQKKWNLNTSIEANVSFRVGDYNWRIGPQLRYQNTPTQIREYPIREYLMDYGFKVGLSKAVN